MRAFPTDILIAKTGGRQALDRIAHDAKVLMAKTVLKRIADSDSSTFVSAPPDATKTLEETLHLIELRCLDLEIAWRRDARSDEGIEFRDYCSIAFDIRRVLSLGETEEARVKGAVRLAALGVLGDRSVDIRRYLNENFWPIPELDAEDAGVA